VLVLVVSNLSSDALIRGVGVVYARLISYTPTSTVPSNAATMMKEVS